MCMHEDQNCSRYCPCDCMDCLVAHDHDTRRTSQEARPRRTRRVETVDSAAHFGNTSRHLPARNTERFAVRTRTSELTAYLRAAHPADAARYGS